MANAVDVVSTSMMQYISDLSEDIDYLCAKLDNPDLILDMGIRSAEKLLAHFTLLKKNFKSKGSRGKTKESSHSNGGNSSQKRESVHPETISRADAYDEEETRVNPEFTCSQILTMAKGCKRDITYTSSPVAYEDVPTGGNIVYAIGEDEVWVFDYAYHAALYLYAEDEATAPNTASNHISRAKARKTKYCGMHWTTDVKQIEKDHIIYKFDVSFTPDTSGLAAMKEAAAAAAAAAGA